MQPIGIDLFCGVGGMSLGFEQAGFQIVGAVDLDKIHSDTHALNFPNCKTICKDVADLTGETIINECGISGREIDVLFGGPPCQGFSLIGKRQSDDPRNSCLFEFARLANELKPRYIVVENVEGLCLGGSFKILNKFIKKLKVNGYKVVEPITVLDASDFGVPQRRRRVFILAYREGLKKPSYPKSFKKLIPGYQVPTVWDSIGDLPKIEKFERLFYSDIYTGKLGKPSDYAKILRCEFEDPLDCSVTKHRAVQQLSGCLRTRHTDEIVKRFNNTKTGKVEPTSRYPRLTKNGLSCTLRAGSGASHGSFTAPRPIHPVYPRCITVREAARLHSFPDWFTFHPTKWHGFRQIGNAVPPLLARAVAKSIILALSK